jgi:hypothetical protein
VGGTPERNTQGRREWKINPGLPFFVCAIPPFFILTKVDGGLFILG